MGGPFYVGIDVGTSGVRAVAIDGDAAIAGQCSARMADFSSDHRNPAAWRSAVHAALSALGEAVDMSGVAAICCIGDSVEHDIVGGKSDGVATALVRSGILKNCSGAELGRSCGEFDAVPDYVLESFGPAGGAA